MPILRQLRGSLVVSCQPVDDGPMDRPDIVAAMALAAEAGGAGGLRIEGNANLAAVRSLTQLPIIGIVKHDLAGFPVRITPFPDDVAALARDGANVIAYDATDRVRPVPTTELVAAIKNTGALAMADCATLADARNARADGADIIGTTLSGYANEIAPAGAAPDLDLVRACKALGAFVMAEGRYIAPELAARAMAAGADSVTVGSAVTRIEHITTWFRDAMQAVTDV